MTAKRLLAVVAAVVLVVGAFVIRRDVIEDGDDGASTAETAVDEPTRQDATELVCATELAVVCTELQQQQRDLTVTVENAGVTLDRLIALEEGEDAPLWLTIDPFPAMIDVQREAERLEPLGFESQPLGASQLAIAFPTGGQAAVIATFCESANQPLWPCIGANAGSSWSELGGTSIGGTLRPSLGDVGESALALVSFGHAVFSYFGEADVSATRFGETAFITWLRSLSGASVGKTQRNSTPLATMAVRPALDAAATADYEITTIDETGDEFDVQYPEPEMWIQAVIASPAGLAAPDDLAADVTALLRAHGWDPPDAAQAPPPSASTLLAVRALWNDFT